ncbi:hypothetical protein [Archangium violaceum]|uniref:Uncharacterized protein n=1 Tax=Archangium violaceum Cb vi76 TaxID=1406225 RepID=A0A084SQQ7_9BACT|nr:hypothetical protein [Archangium violaceum]KFA90792.1 hypothetical protein Q664_26100 [Archangium violaceum Cb vi76]
MKKHSGIQTKGKQTASSAGAGRRGLRGRLLRWLKGATNGRSCKALLLLGVLWVGSFTLRLDMKLHWAERAVMEWVVGLSMEGRLQTGPESMRD